MEFKGKNAEYYAGLDKRSKEYREYKEFLKADAQANAEEDIISNQDVLLNEGVVLIDSEYGSATVFTVEESGTPPEINPEDIPENLDEINAGDTYDIPAESTGESTGLGDTIEKITKATGIKKAVDWFANGKDCGCEDRKILLNKIKGYKPECMVEAEYIWMQEYLKRHNKNKYSKEDVYMLQRLHLRIYRRTERICSSCNSSVIVLQNMVARLEAVYNTYQ